MQIHEMVPLFKRAANGKILYFSIKAIKWEVDDYSTIERWWGQLGGTIQQQTDFVHEGRNLGRANQTTHYECAISDATSVWNKKRDEGYKTLNELQIVLTREEREVNTPVTWKKIPGYTLYQALNLALPQYSTDSAGRIKPQILHHLRLSTYKRGTNEYSKSKNVKYPCIVQPKYDGVCCVASTEHGLITRGGKDRHTPGGAAWKDICPQIFEEIERLNFQYPLHGEVYLHGSTLDDITEATKKQNLLSTELVFVVYDVVETSLNATERLGLLEDLRGLLDRQGNYNYIKVSGWSLAHNEKALIEYEQEYLTAGYEGLVARNTDGKYVPGERSKDVLKLVRFESSEYTIVDIVPMDNEPTHGIFVVDCKTSNGELLRVTPGEGFTDAKRKDILKNKATYIGQQLTIRHRGYTQYGTPRIATGEAIRPIGS